MSRRLRIVLNTFGSFGDLHPYMAIALELRERGYDPLVATMEGYREKLVSAGLSFAPVRPNIPSPKEQDSELIDRIMDPLTGPKYLMEKVIFAAVRESYEDLIRACSGADLLVTHPAAPAGPLVGYKTRIPWVSTALAPMTFFSAYDPPVPPAWQWVNNLKLLGPGVVKLFHGTMQALYSAREVNALRDELSIPDYGNPMFSGQHSPTMVLALFSQLFASPQPDWPKQTHTTGFCIYEAKNDPPMTAELVQFLNDGSPPIVFTLGSSAVWVAKDFYTESIAAAQRLKRRAVLLVGDERNRPGSLPEETIAVDYAAYQDLFPRACAVVHHGGVGTTSHGLLGGVPTLIVPFAFDQSDNADHARRLGTSRTLFRKKYNSDSAARELNVLLSENTYAQRARLVGAKLRQEHGAQRAADLIEQVLSSKQNAIEEPAYALGN